jgi:hypothetical protein
VNIDRDRLLKENEDEARRIKEELVSLREAILRSENALNALAIQRTNLEADSEDERIEIPPELQAFIPTRETVKPPRVWPKVAVGALALAGLSLGLGALRMFDNNGGAPVARQAVLQTHSYFVAPSAKKENEALIDTFSSIPPSKNVNSTSDNVYGLPGGLPINILPGITYTSVISYSVKSSAVRLVEVSEMPLVTIHVIHAPQSFFIPLRTSFRIDRDRTDTQHSDSRLIAFVERKKHDLEIRFESRKPYLERKILGVSSSQ